MAKITHYQKPTPGIDTDLFWQHPEVVAAYLRMSRSTDTNWYEHLVNWPSFKQLLPNKAARVLDFGCGGGEYTDAIAKTTHAIVDACDSSEAMLQAYTTNGMYYNFMWDGLRPIDGIDYTYDSIAAKMVLMFVPDLDLLAKQFCSVLAPNGSVVVSILHPQQSYKDIASEGGSYFKDTTYRYSFDNAPISGEFYHRSADRVLKPFLQNGFRLTHLVEPEIPDYLRELCTGMMQSWLHRPKRLNFRLQKSS